MSRTVTRAASAVLIVALLACLALLLKIVQLPAAIVGNPPVQLPSPGSDRPFQALYQLDAQAARDGWTPDRLRLAGDLWRRAGDLTRAVAYWEAVPPGIALSDAALLRDRAQAYLDLQRWADASDALDQLLTLIPSTSPDRAWAQFQLGLIRLAYDPARALDLLRAAQPTYGDSVAKLLALLGDTSDPVRVGTALASQQLWAAAELALSQSPDPLASAYDGLARDMQGKSGAPLIDEAVALAPQNAQVRFLQALHLRLNYDYPGSLRALVQAVALDPENPALYAELGKAYQLTGDLTTAEHWLNFAVSLDSHFQPLLDSFYNDEKTALLSLGLVDEASLRFDATPAPEP